MALAVAGAATVTTNADASAFSQPACANPSLGRFGLRLLDVPVSEGDNPRAWQYIIDHLTPGTTIHRRVEVSNKSACVLHVAMYPDAAAIAHGSFVGAAGHTVNDLTSWTTLSQGSLDIPAFSTAPDTVTITVPKDAAPGEQYAVIWAEAAQPATRGVVLANRVGTRVYLSIGGDNPPPSSFTVDTLAAQRDAHGHAVVQAVVHNTGGRALDMTGNLKLAKVAGAMTAGPYPAQLGTTLAPGQSEPVTIVVTDQVADGPWDAAVELKSGLLDETFQARITFPRDPGDAVLAAAYPKRAGGHLMLIAAALLAVAPIALATLLVARGRRTSRRHPTPPPGQ